MFAHEGQERLNNLSNGNFLNTEMLFPMDFYDGNVIHRLGYMLGNLSN